MTEDNRKHERYSFFASASTNIVSEGKEVSTLVNNISCYGIGLRSYAPLRKGTRASVDLFFVNDRGIRERERIGGRVAWTIKKGPIFYAGIVFHEEMNALSHPMLYSHFCTFVTRKALAV